MEHSKFRIKRLGVDDLYRFLKTTTMLSTSIDKLKGLTVAVDGYSMLHRGAIATDSCKDICLRYRTSKPVDYCMEMVELLHGKGVEIVFVFHGRKLDLQEKFEVENARLREYCLKLALKYGCLEVEELLFHKAAEIPYSLALELIERLKERGGIKFIVAPYDANAQLTFLAKQKIVDAVISDDSALILFGCPRVVYELDKSGQGLEYSTSKLYETTGLTEDRIREMGVLSTCKYFSVHHMNFNYVNGLFKSCRNYDEVIEFLSVKRLFLSQDEVQTIQKALLAFKHQRIYDPRREEMVFLTDFSPRQFGDSDEFLGSVLSKSDVKGIANGELDPDTMQEIINKSDDGYDSSEEFRSELYGSIDYGYFNSDEDDDMYSLVYD